MKIGTNGIWRMLILISTLVFWISNPKSIFRQIWAKKVKVVRLPENWHTWYLEDAHSYFSISFLHFQPKNHFWANFGQKSQSCLFCLNIGTHGILRILTVISTLVFWISKPKFLFLANLGRKSQSCPYWLKIGTQTILTILILIPTLLFSVSNPKSIFGQILAEKFKVVHFDWRLTRWGCWFLFRH